MNQEDNIKLTKVFDIEEIKEAIINMSACSATGPDGYNGYMMYD